MNIASMWSRTIFVFKLLLWPLWICRTNFGKGVWYETAIWISLQDVRIVFKP